MDIAAKRTAAKVIHLPVLNPKPAPETEDPEAVAAFRKLDCQSYDRCLDRADERGWSGFACTECHAYKPLTPIEQARDWEGMQELLASLQLVKPSRKKKTASPAAQSGRAA